MGTTSDDFNVLQFEKRLTQLKDSQDHINSCCKWCLENRQHHKKIVNSWLNVLKRVKVEQRVNLFYLANDVIQYSKRKHYDFVDSWGTALQKATTLVRDEKVKHKIIRIFNIWQQRGVYNEDFISDLCGLISVVPTASKNDEPHEFQASYVINKIKQCSKLENETDLKLKVLKEHNPKIQIETESLCTSLKDRAHVDDVEKELETYVKHLEGYINALKAEIKCRIANISVLKQANTHLDKDKKDVKLVANAYKVFGNKIKTFQRKLEEHKETLTSPVPSPDINAPSPSPDCDIELPDDNETKPKDQPALPVYNPAAQFTAGYYNPVPPPATDAATNFVSNGYTSFIGTNFNMQNLAGSSLFTNTQTTVLNNSITEVTNSNFRLNNALTNVLQSVTQPPPPPTEAAPVDSNFQYQGPGHMPLLPPPMPPFSAKSDYEPNYGQSYNSNEKNSFAPTFAASEPTTPAYDNSVISEYPSTPFEAPPDGANPYPPAAVDEYNPEQELETWDTDPNWAPDTDTPESPPIFEKEGYVEGVEYHDNVATGTGGDVDHRMLQPIQLENIRGRGKDVDHRNLISLTGSPADTNINHPPVTEIWGGHTTDQDYRTNNHNRPPPPIDQDYRISHFNIEQLKLPPPPPPPQKPTTLINNNSKKTNSSPRKLLDNVESIDMELSEDENEERNMGDDNHELKPPPPLPDLPDDVDANSFLDEFNNELNSNEFTANLQDPDVLPPAPFNQMGTMPPPAMFANMPPPQHMNNTWSNQPPPPQFGFRGRGGRGNNNNHFRGGNVGRNNQRGGRGRGNYGFRGGNNFRGRGFGMNRPNRAHRARGNNMRGNFQGGYC